MTRTFLKRVLFAAMAVLVFAFGHDAHAHGMRSAYLEIHESEPGIAVVRLRAAVPAPALAPRLPDGCVAARDGAPRPSDSGDVQAYVARCPRSLAGETVGVDGLGGPISDGVISITVADGRVFSHVVTARAPTWLVPVRESALATAGGYVRLGLVHIATGADHLLFLVLLVLVVRKTRAVLLAETAFTLSHTMAFAATATGLVHVAPAAAEACIALSLVLVALDVNRADARMRSARNASLVAFAFGLVHGLGFAGGLREVGLPDEHAAAALAGFGVGVEAGQLAVVLGALALVHALENKKGFTRGALAVAYASGGLATYWLVERLVTCLAA